MSSSARALLCLFLAGCGAEVGAPDASASPDAGGSPDSGATLDAAALADAGAFTDAAALPDAAPDADSGVVVDPWAAVDALLEARVRTSTVQNLAVGLVVMDAQDHRVHEHMVNGFRADRMVAVASASKMISGLVIFDLIRQNQLGLDQTTGDVLHWTGPKAAITLRHLLSFTSGMEPENTCTSRGGITLEACVQTIEAVAPKAPPGTIFDYGSTHLAVAGRMAEVVTGKTWNQLFTDTLATPLGLPSTVTYFTAPRQMNGTTNPLIAGGLRASIDQYLPMLALVFHRGQGPGALRIGTDALFSEQAKQPYPVQIAGSPMAEMGFPYRYGLTAWLECATPDQGCGTVSSAGAFGFTPVADRDAGYYAILAMEQVGGAKISFPIEQALEPLIRAALGR
ncbi:MAG: serine hydrolase domain-containing protein [Myxococcota bacterium]